MGQSSYPHGFNGDLVVRGLPVVNSYSKSAWWVDSAGSNQGDGTFKRPWASIEIATNSGKVVAGDQVHCKAGHVETITAAAGLDLDVAGVTVFFHGQGANRAQITFTTAVGADMDIDAANITLVNPLFVAGIDALTGPIDVNSADFTIINGEWRDAPAMGTTDAIVADANADRMTIDGWRFVQSTTGTQKQSQIQVAAANDVVLRNIDIFGDFGTGAVENGTAWINALLENVRINNTSASPTVGILLQATSTGAMRNVHIRVASGTTYLTANNDMEFFECYGTGTDATAGELIGTVIATSIEGVVGEVADAAATGAVTSTDTLVAYIKQLVTQNGIELDTNTLGAILYGTGGIATFPSGAAAANAVSMAEVLRYAQENIINGAGTTLPSGDSLYGVLAGATGITTFPAAALPANSVSIAEVLREAYDQEDKAVTNTAAVLVTGGTLFTIAGGPIEILSLVARCVTGNDGTASTLQWSADPTDGAAATFSGASASLANAAAGAMVILLGTALTTAPTVTTTGVGLSFTGATPTNGIIVGAGIITSTVAVGSTTGTWQMHMRYRPLSRGVTVT